MISSTTCQNVKYLISNIGRPLNGLRAIALPSLHCILIHQRRTINEFENNFFKALVRVDVLHALAFILTLRRGTMGKCYLKSGTFVFEIT